MRFPENLKYTKDHEWAKVEGNSVVIGITDHAQSALGDVVYVELPAVGRTLKAGETFGVVESIKAVSDLYAPISGKVVAVNSSLADNPSVINQDSQGSAWMIKIEPTDASGTKDLMDSASYTKFVESLK
jgi:glycine cleavage system H protein